MGDGLDYSAVHSECGLEEVLAVSCRGAADDLYFCIVPESRLLQSFECVYESVERVAAVVAVIVEYHLSFFIEKDGFSRRGARIDA